MQRRILPLIAPLAFVALLASCGVERGDQAASSDRKSTTTTEEQKPSTTEDQQATTTTEPDSTTTDPDAPTTTLDPEVVDALEQTYRTLGFTDEEAACLAEGVAGLETGDGSMPDLTSVMDIVNECNIPADRLMEITGGLGDGTMEGTMKAGIEAALGTAGLTDEQASCVADAYLEDNGVSLTPDYDPETFVDYFDQCDVDPSQLATPGN